MNSKNSKRFLYAGLSLLLIAILGRYFGLPNSLWIPLFTIAILLKIVFLINVFRAKNFKMSLPIKLILLGVGMILISMIFKNLVPIPWLRAILFYGAIALKITGVSLLVVSKKEKF